MYANGLSAKPGSETTSPTEVSGKGLQLRPVLALAENHESAVTILSDSSKGADQQIELLLPRQSTRA